MEKRKKKFSLGFDRLVAILTIPVAIFLIVVAYQAPRPNIPQAVGPEFLPIAALSLMILCAIVMFIDSTRSMRRSQPPQDEPVPQPASGRFKTNMTLVLVIAGLAAYAAILDTIGFIISTTLLVIWSARMFEKGKWVRNVIVSLLFSITVYYCFVNLLEVTLPVGVLGW